MKKMSIKLVIMMAVCLHLTACGKKKSDGDVQSQQQTQAPIPTDSSTETGDAGEKTDVVTAQDDQNKSDKSDKSENQKDPSVPSTPGAKIHVKTKSLPGSEKGSSRQISDNESLEKLRQAADRFSGAADDYLRTYLIAQEDSLSEEQQILNLRAAQNIQSANLKIDYNRTGDVAMTLNMGSGANKKTILLGGIMKQDRTASLRSGQESLRANLKCMDVATEQNNCETALVTMKMNNADVKIIFRRSNMEIGADFGMKQCMTQACEDVYAMFRQSDKELDIKDIKSIKVAKLESYEIINGRSAFRAIIRTRGNTSGGQIEAIVIAGDLLNQEVMPTMNATTDRTIKIEDLVDLRNISIHTNFQNAMSDVRIVGNDGQGKISMKVNMKRLGNGANDSFDLSFKRVSGELMPLVQLL
jgi:hypothetical protein